MGNQISIGVGVDAGQFQSGLAAMRQSSSKFTTDLRSQLVGAIGGFALLTTAANVFKRALDASSQAQKLRASLETLTGSAAQAKLVLSELEDLAASTPLTGAELGEAAKMLIAFGESTTTVTDTLRKLGDIAAGVGMPLSELAELFGKARTQGTIFAEDLNQLSGRGVPIIQSLAKHFGVAESQIKKMASEGKIGFEDMRAALFSLTQEGGAFFQMMSKQAGTFEGQVSTLGDAWEKLLRKLSDPVLEAITGQISKGTSLLEKMGTVAEWVSQQWAKTIIAISFFAEAVARAKQMVDDKLNGRSSGMSFVDRLKKEFAELQDFLADQHSKLLPEDKKEIKFRADVDRQLNEAKKRKQPVAEEVDEKAAKAAEKIKEREQRLKDNEAEAARDRLEGEARINALIKERNRLRKEAANAPDDDKRLDALEKEQKVRRDIEKEQTKQQEDAAKKAEDRRKQDEQDILAIALAREEEAKARREEQLDQMTPQQRIAQFQREKNQLEQDAKDMEETDPALAAQKRTEAIALGKQIRDEQGKLDDESKRKAEELKSKMEEDAKKREDSKRRGAEVPVSSLQAVGGGGRAGPSSGSDPVLREVQRQTQSLQELVMLTRQQLGVTSAPKASAARM
ncbi:tape measure protein [Verrucomicrobium sp. BvORR106]|uniref:tape measure protein n=1 Tax=Verrucomicrobium sp. BvORR106 TaxID=1403819 RepID=UPI00056DADF8|nr:tape measure protein [Verrucomicrobium sp. BvORR106]